MRFLHTSDWHLGRTFHGTSLFAEQRAAMDRLVDAVTEHGVDAVLVPGDVYDRALPAVDVVELLDRTLERIVAAGAQIVITSGNHDSAVRLGFGGALLERAGVHLRTRLEDLERPVVFADEAQDVLVYGIPYLEPRLVAGGLGANPAAGHAGVIAAAMERIMSAAGAREGAAQRPQRVVVLAHVFAAGGEGSESERPLAVGELDRVPATAFAPADYAALGHLHGAQAPLENVRYSGSPLPYSFSEAEQSKRGLLIDILPGAPAAVTELPWPPPRPLVRVRGTLERLLADPSLAEHEDSWVQATLTDAARPERAMERLQERFPHALVLRWEPEAPRPDTQLGYRERLRRAAADPTAVAKGFVDHVRERPVNEEEEALLAELVGLAAVKEGAK